jgi:hemerythrin-like domain-containing protein
VKVLSEYIKHHVKEEENEIFPAVSSEKDELDTLGQEMASRKEELVEELGLADDEIDEEEGAQSPNARDNASARQSTRR